MKISINCLRKYIDLPQDKSSIRDLMEDIGLEVKRADTIDQDTIFTLELLANRGDHHSYTGVAREIHGRTGWDLHLPQEGDYLHTAGLGRAVVKTDDCLNYVIAEFRREAPVQSGVDEIKRKMLETSGVNLVSPVVDITNLVNIEIGQPLHVFDADKVMGLIQIRESRKGEKTKLLFTEESRDIPENTIVIADDEKILAIAGVMGCDESKPTDETTRIYLESATFDPVRIRKAARHFGIQSQSSICFERGTDPALALGGAKRAAVLLKEVGWDLVGQISEEKKWALQPMELYLDVGKVNDYFGTSLSGNKIQEMLSRYGFAFSKAEEKVGDNYVVSIPSHRVWDVKGSEDLLEEVAKGIGYNALPSVLPFSISGVRPYASLSRKETVEDLLVGEGFYEVFTDGFYSENHRSKLGIQEDHPLWKHVNVVNAGDRAYSLLKNNTLTQAMELVQTNIHAKNPNIKAFEWTRTFHLDETAPNGLCNEKLVLWAVAYGNNKTLTWDKTGKEVDVYYMKGLVEELSNLLSIPLEIVQMEEKNNITSIETCLHPVRRASILWKGKQIGVLGEVHPDVISSWSIKSGRPCFIELSQEILDIAPSERVYVPPSNLHPVIRDVCLLLPQGFQARRVTDYMQEISPWVSEVGINDVFNSQATTNGKNAVTFSLKYSQEKACKSSFTGDEINQETERLVESTIKKYKNFSLERR